MERWVVIEETPRYLISDLGRVWSLISDIERKPSFDNSGYLRITLRVENSRLISRNIHRLVAEAFLNRESALMQVNHKDGIKTNNCVKNLEWVTGSENTYHAYRTGLKKPMSIGTPIRIIETGDVFESIRACARAIDGYHGCIRECLYGNQKSHHGFTFEFVE